MQVQLSDLLLTSQVQALGATPKCFYCVSTCLRRSSLEFKTELWRPLKGTPS